MSLDTRGQDAALRARAAVARIELPDATAVVIRRRRRRLARSALAGVVVVLVVTIGTVAVVRGAAGPSRSPRVQVQPTTPSVPQVTATVEFRPVESVGGDPFEMAANAAACTTGLPALPGAVIRFDPDHEYCFGLGPVLATGAGLDSASVFYDTTASQWTVDLQWSTDDFVDKVARPLVDKQMAIVVNGVVQSIVVVNPGISGRDVPMTGNFTKDEAVRIVAALTGVAPSAVPIATR